MCLIVMIWIFNRYMGPSDQNIVGLRVKSYWHIGNSEQIPSLNCHRIINWTERHTHMDVKLFVMFNAYGYMR